MAHEETPLQAYRRGRDALRAAVKELIPFASDSAAEIFATQYFFCRIIRGDRHEAAWNEAVASVDNNLHPAGTFKDAYHRTNGACAEQLNVAFLLIFS